MGRYSEYIIAVTILVQNLLLITINNEIIASGDLAGLKPAVPMINALLIAICLVSLVAIRQINQYREARLKSQMMKKHLGQVEELIKTLQGEKHQFAGHLQTVQALIELGRFEEASAYLDNITAGEIPPYNRHYTDHFALSVLLNRKTTQAQEQGIQLDTDVNGELADLEIASGDVCSIIENLVDNALEAAREDRHPRVRIEIDKKESFFTARISNNGAGIPPGADVFAPGFSTKPGKSRGFGLHVVRQLLDKHRGSIAIDTDGETGVTVKIPLAEISAHE